MNLVEKAKKEAKRNHKTISTEIQKGLKAVQSMHDLSKKGKGSPYRMYISQKRKKKK